MGSTDKPTDADDQSRDVIDIDVGGEDVEEKLRKAGAPPVAVIQSQLEKVPAKSGNKVEMVTDTMDGTLYKRGKTDWGEATDGSVTAPKPMPDELRVVDGDMKDQAISDALVAAVQASPSPAVIAETDGELPELAPVVKPTMTLVMNDEKTPPRGTDSSDFHTGLSLPDQEPIQEEPVFQEEPAKPMPAMPGSRMLALIESEDMNRKDEADPKTDAMELRSFRPVGTMVKSDALLLRSKTAKPFEKTVDELRRAKERMLRGFDLKERRTLLLQEQWKRRDQKARLEERREKELAARKAIEDEEAALKKVLGDAKDKMRRHQSDAGSAQEMASKQKEKMQGEFEKLNDLAKLLRTLIEAATKVTAAKSEPDVDLGSAPGTESMKALTVLLNPLMDLPTTWSEFLSSRRLELQEKGAYDAILQEHKPLLAQFGKLKESKEPINGRIAEIAEAIGGVEAELASQANEIAGIDRELKELEPPEEPAAEEPQEET